MPTTIHELFLASFQGDVADQLKTIGRCSNERIATVARQICASASGDLFLDDKEKRSPDWQWRHERGLPPLVVEISYSQKTKDLSRLADEYIVGSNGSIGTVVGIDIKYRGTKEARIMKWQLNIITEDGETYIESKLISNDVSLSFYHDQNVKNLTHRSFVDQMEISNLAISSCTWRISQVSAFKMHLKKIDLRQSPSLMRH